MLDQEGAMTREKLQSLILKRMNERDQFYAAEHPDAENIVAHEREIASRMPPAGLALDTRQNLQAVKSRHSALRHCDRGVELLAG